MGQVKQYFEDVIERKHLSAEVGRKIKTHQLMRTGDWCAWFEFDDIGHAGFGRTEEEAIDELLGRNMQ